MININASEALGCKQCKSVIFQCTAGETRNCPVCGLPQLERMETTLLLPPIEMTLQDKLSKAETEIVIARFIKPVRFCTPGLNNDNLMNNLKQIYLPYWMVDSTARGNWNATFGYDYQVESAREIFHNNQWNSKAVEETRIDWEHRTGLIDRSYHNITINSLTRQNWLTYILGEYQFNSPANINNGDEIKFIIFPDIHPTKSWENAKPKFEEMIKLECQQAAGAQHVKAFASHIDYSDVNWTLLIAPFYYTHYFDDSGLSHSIWINPQSGKISGEKVSSQKIANRWGFSFLGAALLFLIFGVLFTLLADRADIGIILAVFSIFAFIILFISGVYAFIYPWQHNRKNRIYLFDQTENRS